MNYRETGVSKNLKENFQMFLSLIFYNYNIIKTLLLLDINIQIINQTGVTHIN